MVIGLPIKKCARVKARRSFGLVDSGVNGREIKIASIRDSNLESSSKVNL